LTANVQITINDLKKKICHTNNSFQNLLLIYKLTS